MPIAIIIAILLAGGVSLGAQKALPGDALYGVKTDVNERIESAFSFGDEAKAATAEKIANARLTEAEQLSAQGKLTNDERASLAASFVDQADVVSKSATDLSAKGDAATAAKIKSDFSLALNNHLAILQGAGSSTATLAASVSSALRAEGEGGNAQATASSSGKTGTDTTSTTSSSANVNIGAGASAGNSASSSTRGSSVSGNGALDMKL